MGKLNEICKEIKAFEGFNFTDDMILDCATRIFNSMNIQTEKVNKAVKNQVDNNDKPTEAQLTALDRFGIKYPETITKQQAGKLIDERIQKINARKGTK